MSEKRTYFSYFKKGLTIRNYWVYTLFAVFIAIGLVLSITDLPKASTYQLFEQIGYTIVIVISLSLVVGFLGELSLGHAGFMSIGAFTGMFFQQVVLNSLASQKGFPAVIALFISMIVGGTIAAVFGFIISLPALRLKGDYLAIVTLAFGEIVKVFFQNIDIQSITNKKGSPVWSTTGIIHDFRFDYKWLYIIIFAVALLFIVMIRNLLRSPHGRNIMAIRDNEIAAKAMGVNVVFYKIFVFVLSAFIAGVAGVLFGVSQATFAAAKFDYNYSINNILVIVVLGGMGNLEGSIIAAIVVALLNNRLQSVLSGDLAALKNVIYAMVLIIVVIYNNAPFLKRFREKYNLRNAFNAIKAKIVKPKDSEDPEKGMPDPSYGADWSKIPTKIPMDAIVTTDVLPSNDGDEWKGEN
ncbi:MAG: branched-chain amino acid ABC transporter permease [Bacilli bacterium]|nr:branched-chain amino acid ABC transporter permease [Bacilli bacterium]